MSFLTGLQYTRKSVLSILGIPDSGGGQHYTGYFEHDGDIFIFTNIESEGRTGHNYGNRWLSESTLLWHGRTESDETHKYIRKILGHTCSVFLFTRKGNRDPFTFNGLVKAKKHYERNPIRIELEVDPEKNSEHYDGVVAEPMVQYLEGKSKVSYSIRMERSRAARQECLRTSDYRCKICGFNFRSFYGEAGEGFIQVHHLTPVHTKSGIYEVDPSKDLLPICANCHSLIHRRVPEYTPDEVRKMIEDNGKWQRS